MNKHRIIYCCCCGRQVIQYTHEEIFYSDKYSITDQGSILMWENQVCCGDCAKDLNEYGLFSEEG